MSPLFSGWPSPKGSKTVALVILAAGLPSAGDFSAAGVVLLGEVVGGLPPSPTEPATESTLEPNHQASPTTTARVSATRAAASNRRRPGRGSSSSRPSSAPSAGSSSSYWSSIPKPADRGSRSSSASFAREPGTGGRPG